VEGSANVGGTEGSSPVSSLQQQVANLSTSASGNVEATPAGNGHDSLQPGQVREASYGDVVNYVAAYDGGDCFAAIPAIDGSGQLALNAFSPSSRADDVFKSKFGDTFGANLPMTASHIDIKQCSALSFVAKLPGYPSLDLSMLLANDHVQSGHMLTGDITNASGRPVHLMIVDDDGKMQSIDKYLTKVGTQVTFTAPVFLTGKAESATQLIVAIAAPADSLQTLDAVQGTDATRFFAQLQYEMTIKGVDASVGIHSFVVSKDAANQPG
jgi:hypothetical protein